MILRLRYGRELLAADLRGLVCRVLQPAAPRHPRPARELVAEALDAPRGAAPLAALAAGRRRITVLVPDATRKASLPEVLPAVLDRLRQGGSTPDSITVLVACGTHPPAPEPALRALLGPLPEGVEVLQHDARDEGSLVEAGTTPRGVKVRLHRRAVEADLLVSVSTVQHHYFAGFGGGPKLVFPGVSGYEEIQANHSQVLDLETEPPRRRPGCEPGVLEGNPVAEEIRAAAALRPPDLALLMVNGEGGTPCWAGAGTLEAVFPEACRRVREWYEVDAGPFSRMVVSAGGHPTDATLIQAHKSLDAACRFLAPGGEVLWLAACDEGPGSAAMEPFLEDPRPEALFALLRRRYVQYGHTTLRLVEKAGRFRVLARTGLAPALAERLGLEPVEDVAAVLARWREESPGETVGVMPETVVYPALPLSR